MKRAFRLDLNRCTGCHACILACANEKGTMPGRNWRQVVTLNEFRHPGLPLIHISMACNHCDEPACLLNCPAAAFRKDDETGAVVFDEHRCLGCTYCTWACPFDAPRYNSEKGVIEKCDFCLERLRHGLEPACVTCCPTGALQLAERRADDGRRPRIPGFSRTRLKPAVEFVPLRGIRSFPECTAPPDRTAVRQVIGNMLLPPPRKISLRSEWALLIFTTLTTLLVSFFAAGMGRSLRLDPLLFLGAGAGAMIFSSVHLGRKERAWRAIFNWRRSWLSLEILMFLLFMGAGGLFLLFMADRPLLGWAVVGLGFCALFAVDRIYQKAMKTGPGNFHSAQTLFSGLYLTGILVCVPLLFVPAGLAKLGLYLQRKIAARRRGLALRPLISLARMIMGFAAPALLVAAFPDPAGALPGMAAVAVVIGDLIDRGEFYQELEVVTPRGQMLADLQERLRQIGC